MNTQLTLYTIIRTVVSKYQFVILPTNGKQPHVRAGRTIRHFWTNPPTQPQTEAWFGDREIKSYAVLCGKISGNLFVLDFDDKQEYRKFKQQFPRIAQSLTVKTRRGYHVYLRADKPVKAQKIRGGDLQGEGTYVIGPGSSIEGQQYTIKSDQQIYKISNNEFKELITETSLISKQLEPTTTNISKIPQKTTELVTSFQTLAPKYGRNNALYRVATRAKVLNIPIGNIKQKLVETYTAEKPHWYHQQETDIARVREALRTIESAYKTKSRPLPNTGRLPTALREEMLKASASENQNQLKINSSTVHGRLLEALLIEDIKEHQTFTIKEAQEIGKKYRISTKGVYQVLRGKQGITPTEERIFRIVKHPPHVWDNDNTTINKNYSLKKIKFSGRKIQFAFMMPSIEELCSMYNVIPQSWDSLEPEDLMSSKAYKEAIHREYIRRCSPEQSVTYLANRLGCHPRTIYRYDANLDVKTIPIFGFTPLTWANVDDSQLYGEPRADGITPGKWLQRTDGKRFPSVKGIALCQLSQGKTLVACERRSSRRLLSQPESDITSFSVIWRRSDFPIGEWDIGGSPYILPELGPDISPSITNKVIPKNTRVSEPKQSNPTPTGDNLVSVRSQQKQPSPHPMLNHSLTLVPGIGLSRQDKLYDLGISTLSDLVNADPQQLISGHWYGGYVTIHTIRNWQEEAAILLGWRERDPASIEKERRKQAIQIYRKYLKSLMNYVDKTFTLINSIAPIKDLPEIEPTRIYLKLKSLDNLSKQRNSKFYKQSYNAELRQIARDFFTFVRGYIEHMLSLQDWQLEEYGFGDRAFWKRQYKSLERQKNHWLNHMP